MELRTENFCDQVRRGWCDVAVAYDDVADHPADAWYGFEAKGWPVVRGPDIGDHTGLLFVYGEWDPYESVVSTLTAPQPAALTTMIPSNWVAEPDRPESIYDLVPHPVIQLEEGGPHLEEMEFFHVVMVENNGARQVWYGYGRIKHTMLVFRAWVYIYTAQDAVKVEFSVTNSDPRTDEHVQRWHHLAVKTGEFWSCDFREHKGMPFPQRDLQGNWIQIVSGPRTLDDAQQITFTGWLLCLPSNPLQADYFSVDSQRRLASLLGYLTIPGEQEDRGAILGCSLNWHGNWGAFGPAPKMPLKEEIGDLLEEYRRYVGGVTDLYNRPPWGLAKHTGSTGAQEDFGACKGAGVVTGLSPELLLQLQLAVTEPMRSFHHCEADGKPIVAADHPHLITWGQETDDRFGGDYLGKGGAVARNGTGFGGEDDQHRSQNNFNAYYALTGSYMAKQCMEDFLEIDLTMHKEWYRAPRAQGRLFAAWGNMLRLLEPERREKLLQLMRGRFAVTMEKWPGKAFIGSPETPIRVLKWTEDPRIGLNGQAGWVVWEHAIAAMGYYGASLQTDAPDKGYYLGMAQEMGELVTRYGCFFDGIHWRCCTTVRYLLGDDEGKPLPPGSYRVGSKDIVVYDAFWRWTLAAVKICRETTDNEELASIATNIIADVEGEGPSDWNQAEWWAVV